MQRQHPGAGGEGQKRHSGERLTQLIEHEVYLVRIPCVSGGQLAAVKVGPGLEGHISDIETGILTQQRHETADEGDLLLIRQVVQGVGSDNGVILTLYQRFDQTGRKIAAVKFG